SIILTEKQKIIAYKITTTPTSPIRLAFFDTDSTFINEEVIDELAAYAGVKDEVAQITERAMRGELDFDSALKERVSLLKGIPENVFSEIRKNRISLTRGARELTQYFKEKDIAAYLVSGGFSYFTQSIADELNLTGQFANTLESIDGILSGNTLGRIVNRERKGEILQELAKKHRVSLENVLAVGDGANDLQMLHLSALGIAFCAKPALLNETTAAIFERDLRFVRYLIDTPNGV
ncbi:MAG TPA: phosphoserine phosphatase SerB, partial [Turneriella sp.]|nr:phosphoserine phosphatase SerB [Turneriella sp.]